MGHTTEGGMMQRIPAPDIAALQEENARLRHELQQANDRIAFLRAMNDEFYAAARNAQEQK